MFIFVTDKCIFKTTNSAMSRQTPFIACICITAIAVCIALPSCRKADSSAERVKQWIGREFLFPVEDANGRPATAQVPDHRRVW